MKLKEYSDNNSNVIFYDIMLECPFCGGDPELSFIGNNHTKSRKVRIKCKKCRVQMINVGLRFDHKKLLETMKNIGVKTGCIE